jgi:hypothetical protein
MEGGGYPPSFLKFGWIDKEFFLIQFSHQSRASRYSHWRLMLDLKILDRRESRMTDTSRGPRCKAVPSAKSHWIRKEMSQRPKADEKLNLPQVRSSRNHQVLASQQTIA